MYLKQCKKSCRGRQLSFPGKKGSHVVWIISSVCNRSSNQEIIKSGNLKKIVIRLESYSGCKLAKHYAATGLNS